MPAWNLLLLCQSSQPEVAYAMSAGSGTGRRGNGGADALGIERPEDRLHHAVVVGDADVPIETVMPSTDRPSVQRGRAARR